MQNARTQVDSKPTIPVIDVSPFIARSAGAGEVVAAIEAACRETGFFLVTGHGVSREITAELYNLARDFFDEPQEWKRLQGRGTDVEGGVAFSPIADEALSATLGIKTPGDYKESLNFGPRLPGDRWPDRPSGLQAAFRAYFAEMETLARHLRRAFCEAIGLSADHFETAFDNHMSALRVINYPEQTETPLPGQLRAGVHTDYGFMTILRSEASREACRFRQGPENGWTHRMLTAPMSSISETPSCGGPMTSGFPHRTASPIRRVEPAARHAGNPFPFSSIRRETR